MKTYLIGLTILGLTNLANSQTPNNQIKLVNLEEVVVSPMKNVSYFNAVNDPNASDKVQVLQTEAGNFDITTSSIFSNTYETYRVLFQTTDGNIVAAYDSQGQLLNSFEKFKGVRLPEKVLNTLKSKYPDWILNSTTYRVSYYHNKDVKKVYQLQIEKDNKKMNLKIDSDGTILKSAHKSVL